MLMAGHDSRAVVTLPAVELSDQARRALARLRESARDLRFEVAEICHSGRWRLSVHYRAGYPGAPGTDEFRLGLLYSSDREGLVELGQRLAEAEAEAGRTAAPAR
jgi:hypothetical protein